MRPVSFLEFLLQIYVLIYTCAFNLYFYLRKWQWLVSFLCIRYYNNSFDKVKSEEALHLLMISIFCLGTCHVELGIKSQIFFFYFLKRNYFFLWLKCVSTTQQKFLTGFYLLHLTLLIFKVPPTEMEISGIFNWSWE